MNHLNYFAPYLSKPEYHEDQLTRAFLVVLRYVPFAQSAFIEIIRDQMNDKIIFPSYLIEDVSIEYIDTQVSNLPTDGVTDLVAVMMTDNNWTEELEVRRRNCGARYDGVIQVGSVVLTIENKPCSQNIWKEQINPSLPKESGINVYKKGIVLYWANIINMLTAALSRNLLGHCENALIRDFLSFIQENFPLLNPYHNLEICKGNDILLNLRCKNIMEKIAPDSISYHRGSNYYLEVTPGAVKQIYLRYRSEDQVIYISLYPGDTMSQAKELYNGLDIERLVAMQSQGWKIYHNLHFSHIQKHVYWSESAIEVKDYVIYWKKHPDKIVQVNRGKTTLFNQYFDEILALNMIRKEDAKALEELFNQTLRNHIRPCPGLSLEYNWPLAEASRLDGDDKFVDEVKTRIQEAFNAWHQTFIPSHQKE